MNKSEYRIPEVAKLRAEGLNQTDIAAKTGLSQPTVSRLLSDDRARAIIEECRAKVAEEAYLQATENIVTLINEFSQPVSRDENGKVRPDSMQRREQGFKASVKVLESIGIFPSRTVDNFIANILQVNQSNYSSPLVEKVLMQSACEIAVQDVEEGGGE